MRFQERHKWFLVAIIFILTTTALHGDGPLFTDDNWVPLNQSRVTQSDMVNAIQVYQGKLYIGGNFSKIGSINAKFGE